MNYTQCRLRKNTQDGFTETITWIPEKYAKLNEILKLKNNGIWDDGWLVVHVGQTKEEIPFYKILIRKHKQNTGDSLPK